MRRCQWPPPMCRECLNMCGIKATRNISSQAGWWWCEDIIRIRVWDRRTSISITWMTRRIKRTQIARRAKMSCWIGGSWYKKHLRRIKQDRAKRRTRWAKKDRRNQVRSIKAWMTILIKLQTGLKKDVTRWRKKMKKDDWDGKYRRKNKKWSRLNGATSRTTSLIRTKTKKKLKHQVEIPSRVWSRWC